MGEGGTEVKDRPATGDTAVLVPVKAFGEAKRRLSSALDPAARAALARRMAANVVAAAAPFAVAVVCDDEDVAAWAHEHGALVLHEPGRGLNGAVESLPPPVKSRTVSRTRSRISSSRSRCSSR